VVSLLDPGDVGADVLDDPSPLVAPDQREPVPAVPVAEVLVGVAETGVEESDQDLVRLRRIEIELADLPVVADASDDRGFGLRGPSPPWPESTLSPLRTYTVEGGGAHHSGQRRAAQSPPRTLGDRLCSNKQMR
jgi:hypothetical protein